MAGFLIGVLGVICVAGGAFYGLAYLRAKAAGTSVTAELSNMISKLFGLE